MIKKTASILLPKGSPQRRIVKNALVKLKLKNPNVGEYYNLRIDQQRLQAPLHVIDSDVESSGLLISVVVPVYNPSEHYFAELIYSVTSQAYENWELILSDASTDEIAKQMIAKYTKRDIRIKHLTNDTKGISRNTNYGISKAKGEYIAFCDHDDVLEPLALYEVARVIVHNGADIIYTDEDKISDKSDYYFDPHFKPDWSPDLFTNVNYINHLTVAKKSLIEKVGCLDPSKDGAQDYDLLLKLMDETKNVVHIPKVLYHWRATTGSTAQDFGSKKYITKAGVATLTEHFERKGLAVEVTPQADKPGFYDLAFEPYKKVSIIVEPFASEAVISLFVDLLIKKTHGINKHIEIITPYKLNIENDDKKLIYIDNSDDYMQQALSRASSETVVLFNQPHLPRSDAWVQELTGIMRQDHIHAISPVVVKDNNIMQDCGLVYNGNGVLTQLFRNQELFNNHTYFGNTDWVRNVNALSGGVLVARRKDILDFIKRNGGSLNKDNNAMHFSLDVTDDKYNVIYTNVVFESNLIEFSNPQTGKTFFNNNLVMLDTNGYELYSSEGVAINILLEKLENEKASKS